MRFKHPDKEGDVIIDKTPKLTERHKAAPVIVELKRTGGPKVHATLMGSLMSLTVDFRNFEPHEFLRVLSTILADVSYDTAIIRRQDLTDLEVPHKDFLAILRGYVTAPQETQ